MFCFIFVKLASSSTNKVKANPTQSKGTYQLTVVLKFALLPDIIFQQMLLLDIYLQTPKYFYAEVRLYATDIGDIITKIILRTSQYLEYSRHVCVPRWGTNTAAIVLYNQLSEMYQ